MNFEAVGSIIVLIGVAFFARHLHKTGKEIQRQQRELEEKRVKASNSENAGLGN